MAPAEVSQVGVMERIDVMESTRNVGRKRQWHGMCALNIQTEEMRGTFMDQAIQL
jgi:hypothetical protein